MNKISGGSYSGERALFAIKNVEIENATFHDGESPLKETRNIRVNNCTFKWKYPMWYSHRVNVENTTLEETARSGIWYTRHIQMNNCDILAPKIFRRSSFIELNNCKLPNALETMWNCKDIKLNNVDIKGDYFGFGSKHIKANNINVYGNYIFDGGSFIEVNNSYLESKDAFWNCHNVTVRNSKIVGEYFGWNSSNVTLINCEIESHQGFCYMKNIKLVNCKIINSDLIFEFCENIDAEVKSTVDSIKNPISGKIIVNDVKELILDSNFIDPKKTKIEVLKK